MIKRFVSFNSIVVRLRPFAQWIHDYNVKRFNSIVVRLRRGYGTNNPKKTNVSIP